MATAARSTKRRPWVSVQAKCSLADAVVAMERVSQETDVSVEEIAAMVVAREIRFD